MQLPSRSFVITALILSGLGQLIFNLASDGVVPWYYLPGMVAFTIALRGFINDYARENVAYSWTIFISAWWGFISALIMQLPILLGVVHLVATIIASTLIEFLGFHLNGAFKPETD